MPNDGPPHHRDDCWWVYEKDSMNKRLDGLSQDHKDLSKAVAKLDKTVAVLATKAGAWAALGAVLGSGLVSWALQSIGKG